MAERETPAQPRERSCSPKPASSGEEFLPGFPTFGDYSKALLSQVVKATKSANGLPGEGDDFDYYSSFPGFKTFSNRLGSRINKSIGKLIRHEQLPCYWPQGEGVSSERLEEKFDSLVEANDILLERVGLMLDDAAGIKKHNQPVLSPMVQQGRVEIASWNRKRDSPREALGSFKFIHAKNVQRPQLQFREQIDNSNTPFIPSIRHKPNALVPLPETFQKLQTPISLNALIANAKEWAKSDQRFDHPYQYELDHFEPMDEQLELRDPQLPGSLEEVPLTFVTTEEQLEELQKKLCSVKEFAVDLEHHSYRSFLGIVCLMQVSTRDHDYIIDTLELRHHMNILLDPFTNPNIVKVMHGADWDIHWLQRDCGIYVVNLFDTGQASRVLSLPRYSLAFLLKYCCDLQADKQYQLADWRIRPLPPEMAKYAREDTHYLLYIYDRMRNELIRRGNKQNNLLHSVLDRSRDICLKRYEKPLFTEDAYLRLYNEHKKALNSQQLHCLQLLYAWRDQVAREEDESVGYVLPKHMMFQISEILPREPQGLLACCNPIPTLLRQQLQEVHLLVQQSRETPPNAMLPSLAPVSFQTPATLQMNTPVPSLPQHTHLDTPTPEQEPDLLGSRVKITGPPVPTTTTTLSAFAVTDKGVRLQSKLEEVKRTLPEMLDKFLEAKAMAPVDVILQQRMAGRTLSTPITPGTTPSSVPQSPSPSQPSMDAHPSTRDPAVIKEEGNTPVRGNEKNKMSVREMGYSFGDGQEKRQRLEDRDDGGSSRKVPRLSYEREFKPFDYQGSRFTDFTKDLSRQAEVYNPHASGKKQKESIPRSRVHQRFAEKSQTYTHGRNMSKRPSWPPTKK